MNRELAESYRACQRVARSAASNFYRCFRVLPQPKRHAMHALYAFFRLTDDIADGEDPRGAASRRSELAAWRTQLEATLAGENVHELSLALHDTVTRYAIPAEYLTAALDGAASDLDHRPVQSLEELLEYCYRVASTVGLACIHVWGFTDPRALEPAAACGYAFQMTNILRDIRDDALRGRVYLPLDDLARFDYSAGELCSGVVDDRYRRLMAFQIARTESYYEQARKLTHYLHPEGRRIYRVMLAAYGCLFEQIRRRHGELFSRRISLRWSDRMRLAAGIWVSPSLLPR